MALDAYANVHNLTFSFDKKLKGEIVKNTKYILLKPQTFMNLSGESLKLTMDYYNVELEDVLVIYDDLAIPLGRVRIRQQGSAGGHNGIKSIIAHLQTQEFKRVRLGIEAEHPMSSRDFVLSKFTKKDTESIEEVMHKTIHIMEEFLDGEAFEKIMTKYNG